ncbi:MAG: hypothetical protein J7L42_03985 [Elusimicrobia bacterium]|nr:hypothetical protein [Elusimicrobiota bacterium]
MRGTSKKKPGKQKSPEFSKETVTSLKLGFWFFLAAIFFSPLIFFTNLTRNPYVIQNIVFRTFIFISFFLILFSKKNGFVFFKTFLNIPLFVYGIFITLSIIVSLVFYWQNRTPYLVFWGKRIMFYVFNSLLPFFISYTMAKYSEKTRKLLLYTFFLTATISSLYAILQYTGHEFIWPRNLHHYGSRSVSTFGNPNFLSSYLLVSIILLIPFFCNPLFFFF